MSKTATAYLEGETAGVVVTDAQPEFQFRFAAAGTPSEFPGTGPEEFTLARLKVKDGKTIDTLITRVSMDPGR